MYFQISKIQDFDMCINKSNMNKIFELLILDLKS